MALFRNNSKLFGSSIEPACSYCKHGTSTQNQTMILCEKQGVVSPFFSCRKFAYTPLKRVPMRRPPRLKFHKDDFTL